MAKPQSKTSASHFSMTVSNGTETFSLERTVGPDGRVEENRSENVPPGATIEQVMHAAFNPPKERQKPRRKA